MPDSGTYTIKSGDTLSKVAASLGTTVDALAEANGIRDPNMIAVGQVLKVPGAAPALFSTPAAPTTDVGSDWAALIAKHGDKEANDELAAGKRVIVALRKPTNANVNNKQGRYDDRMIVVQRQGAAVHATEFPINTEPSGQYAPGGKRKTMGVDLNRDGSKDLGWMLADTYHYQRQQGEMPHIGGPFFRSRDIQKALRDLDHDGDADAADGNNLDPTGAGRSMLIHRGGSTNTFSAGCQTVPPSHYNAFLASLGGQTSFSYVLIDLDD